MEITLFNDIFAFFFKFAKKILQKGELENSKLEKIFNAL